MPIILVWIGAGLCTFIVLFVFYSISRTDDNKWNPAAKRYRLTSEMKWHIFVHGGEWIKIELTQWQCRQLGFLSGNRAPDEHYCYNTTVEKCGDVVRFRQNTMDDSSVKYKI